MKFTEEQIEEIESLAGLNYTVKQIAMYLDISPVDIQEEFEDPESEFRYHFDRGQLVAQATIDKANLESAKKGNITAIQRYDKKFNKNRIRQAKERIFGSA